MHRSGTSAITGALSLLGVYPGEVERLLSPAKDNPKGFWEHAQIVDLHERLLRCFSRSWDDIRPLPREWWNRPEVNVFREELKELIKREFSGYSLWMWKDPRTCLLLPLWMQVLRDLAVNVSFVIALRHPLDVAASLKRRDGFLDAKSFALWYLYNLSALYWTLGYKRLIVSYERVLDNGEKCLRSIAENFDIPWPQDDGEFSKSLSEFLAPELCHSRRGSASQELGESLPAHVEFLYKRLIEAERLRHILDSDDFCKTVETLYQDFCNYTEFIYPAAVEGPAKQHFIQVFWPVNGVYTEDNSSRVLVIPDGQTRVYNLEIPAEIKWPLRLDPVNFPSYIEVECIELVGNGRVLSQWVVGEGFQRLRCGPEIVVLGEAQDTFRFLSNGNDPQLFLEYDVALHETNSAPEKDEPLALRVVMRANKEISASVAKAVETYTGALKDRLAEKESEVEVYAEKIARLSKEVDDKQLELQDALFKLAAIQSSLPFKILDRYNRLRQRLLPEGTHRYQFYRLCVKAGHIALDEGLPNMFRRAWRYFRKYGFKNVAAPADYNHLYQLWIEKNEPKPSDFSRLRKEVYSLSYQPRISIVMPVYNVDEVWLREAIESVRNQIYPHWELCIADDGSTRPHIRKVLEEYRQQDDRIKVTYLPHNQGISVASNAALALATGEFVGLLDHDDELAPWTLLEVVKLLNQNPDLDFIYSDEDKLEPDGRRSEPFFKPDFSPDLLMSMNYICHFSVFRRSLLTKIGCFREGFEGSQDYDVILRVIEQTCKVAHIPKILYHWRKIPGSASGSVNAKSYAYKAAVRALEEALERRNICGEITVLAPGRHRIRYKIAGDPLVSIIIPTKDRLELLRRCIESIREKTIYRNYEIIVVDNGSEELKTIDYLRRIEHYGNCRVVAFNQPFNYSCINNFAVAQANGTFLVFLNNDTEVITPEWLEEMLGHAQRKEVGAVGAKLLFPNNTIQHGGVILRLGGVAGHAFYGLPASESGYMGLATVTRNCAAVTGACMMLRRAVFEEVGGFDEELDVAYNDVDLCLRIILRGYYIVWTPHAVLYHHESASRGNHQPERNIRYFCEKWRDFLDRGDPFYNSNLALDRSDFMVKV